jgi:hypothetical protein
MKETRILCGGMLALAGLLAAWTIPSAAAAPARKSPRKKPLTKSAAAKKAPAGAPDLSKDVTHLEILPRTATLDGPRSAQHLVVTAVSKDGATWDVTDRASLTFSNSKLVKMADGRAVPLADGETKVVAKLGRVSSAPATLTVQNSKTPAAVEFVNDIMPILSKGGCNSTACHGSPAGKGGFKLSLFGYEPELDHPAIAKDADGKRVNLKDPAKSLVLQKATMEVPHAGGQRVKPNTREYFTLLEWLKVGAPGLGEFEARVQKVTVLPEQPWMPSPQARQRLTVVAQMSDGTTRDVTDKALFSSNDDAIADVNGAGLVTAKRAGETAIMVRHLGQVAVARVAVLPAWKAQPLSKVEKRNFIDELVQAKLQKLRMVPSDLCTDEEFIRRATLDVCGLIPTVEEVRAFTADRSPDKRGRLIDVLLERPEHVDLWAMKWNDTLRNNPRLTRVGLGTYAKWIREQVAKNRPFDEFARDLLTATGKNADIQLDPNNLPRQLQNRPRAAALVAQINSVPANPAANFFVVTPDPLDVTSAASQIFLGVRIECARCHNHPFEKWTQNDYYGLASFFAGINARGQNQIPKVVMVNNRAPGIRHPKTNEIVEPKTLDNTDVDLKGVTDKRVALAKWMTSPENPFFARATANRVWGHYFGRGIVEPIDDFRVTNPASNPELLDALAKEFAANRFDLKHLSRVILNSRTYQQSSRPNKYNEADASNFARSYPKRMMAEQIYDSISQATGLFIQAPGGGRGGRRRPLAGAGNLLQQAYGGAMPEGPVTRIMQLPGFVPGQRGGNRGPAQFLTTFGKPRREVVCECERSSDGNMGQALELLNGDEVNGKLRSPFGRVQQLARGNKPEGEVIEELYLAALSRKPDAAELSEASSLLRSAKSRSEGVEDVMWGLLNSREFLFNH